MSTNLVLSPPRVRTAPRISVNSLAKYRDASDPLKRASILKGQKFPKEFITNRYNDSFDPMTEFMTDPNHAVSILSDAIIDICGQHAPTDWYAENKILNVTALQKFRARIQSFPLADYDISKSPEQAPHLRINGVEISVRPEFGLVYRGRGNPLGAFKLYVNKSYPLSDEAAAMVATTLHQYVAQHAPVGMTANHRHCFVFDVFAQNIYTAPQSTQQRRASLAAACTEIALTWPSITDS